MSIRIFGLLMAFTAAIFSVSSFAKEQRVVLEADRDRILRSDNPQEIDIYLKELQHPGSLNYEANFLAGLLHLKRDRLDAAVAAFSTIRPLRPYTLMPETILRPFMLLKANWNWRKRRLMKSSRPTNLLRWSTKTSTTSNSILPVKTSLPPCKHLTLGKAPSRHSLF